MKLISMLHKQETTLFSNKNGRRNPRQNSRQNRPYASAGISVNKLVAKIATITISRMDKKQFHQKSNSFLEALDVRKYHGIGKVTKKMYALGILRGKT